MNILCDTSYSYDFAKLIVEIKPTLFFLGIVEALGHFHHLHRYGFRQTESSLHYKVKYRSSY